MRMSRISNQIETRNVKRCSGKVFQESDGSGSGSLSSAIGVDVGVDAVEIVVSCFVLVVYERLTRYRSSNRSGWNKWSSRIQVLSSETGLQKVQTSLQSSSQCRSRSRLIIMVLERVVWEIIAVEWRIGNRIRLLVTIVVEVLPRSSRDCSLFSWGLRSRRRGR